MPQSFGTGKGGVDRGVGILTCKDAGEDGAILCGNAEGKVHGSDQTCRVVKGSIDQAIIRKSSLDRLVDIEHVDMVVE